MYGRDMSEREEKRMGKADFAAYLILAWEQVWDGAIQQGWEWYDPDTTRVEAQQQEGVGE